MSFISKPGSKSSLYLPTRGTLLTTGDTTANTWYEIAAVGTTSALPIGEIGAVFRSPDTSSTQITLGTGDEVYPLTFDRLCKTDADGYRNITGTIGGFAKYDEDTGELTTSVEGIFGRFMNIIEDDGEGTYTETAVVNEKFILFYLLNKDAAVGDVQNWLIIPIILPSFATGAGLKEAQKRDLTWEKAQGYTSLYERTVFADDVITS